MVCSAMTGDGVWESLDKIVAYFDQELGFCNDESIKNATPGDKKVEKTVTNASASTAD